MYSHIDRHTSPLSQSHVAVRIDHFVNDVIRSDEPAFYLDPGSDKPVRPTAHALDLHYLRQMIDLFDGRVDYDYSENLRLFMDACHDVALEYTGNRFTCPDPGGQGYLGEYECMNLLVERVRVLAKKQEYRRGIADRRYEAKRQSGLVAEYVDNVMERYARTLVIRVNLYYRKVARQRLRVEDVFADMDRLVKAKRIDPIFEHATGYILRVEQGEDQGFHIHAAFFFNGSKVSRGFYKAEQIGELWERITLDKGYWHDSGREWRGKAEGCGVGMFHRSDAAGRQNVRKLMTYLVKGTQYLRIKPEGAKTYRTGRVPIRAVY